jgi:phenylacetate-CoA ligase
VERVDRARRIGYGRRVRRWRALLAETESWSAERLAAHQWDELRRVLRHARDRVPHYRAVLRELGADPEDFRTPADVMRLPMLTKADLREGGLERYGATGIRSRNRRVHTTGGTTGAPIALYLDWPDSYAAEWAFMSTMWRRIGYRDGDRQAIIRGDVLPDGRLWMTDVLDGALRMDSRHITGETVGAYVERLRRFRPRFIRAYPSAAAVLARHMLDHGMAPLAGLAGVLCGSENLYDWQRPLIEAALGGRAYSWYGQSERVCLAGECEHDRRLQVFPQYGYTELIAADGSLVTEPGVPGEIVGTGFLTRAQPMIRFRTGDVAVWAEGPCERCGRHYPRFERVEGRIHEFLVGANGRLIPLTSIDLRPVAMQNVRLFRFYQDTPGQVLLYIVPMPAWSGERDEAEIRRDLEPRMGADTALAIEVVAEVPPVPSGKFQWLDQRLPTGYEP